jgi:N-acetylneuraminic acid mutarotase
MATLRKGLSGLGRAYGLSAALLLLALASCLALPQAALAANTWTTTGSLPGRNLHTATLLPNGQVLVAGGHNATTGFLNSAELYDPAMGTWTATGSLNTPSGYHTATLLHNGKVLMAGGYNDTNGYLNSAEL